MKRDLKTGPHLVLVPSLMVIATAAFFYLASSFLQSAALAQDDKTVEPVVLIDPKECPPCPVCPMAPVSPMSPEQKDAVQKALDAIEAADKAADEAKAAEPEK